MTFATRKTAYTVAHRRKAFVQVSVLMLTVAANVASAQNYPTRPLRLVVPYAPGGGVDLVARALAERLTDTLGRATVVDNRGGGENVVGSDIVAKATPDGYTMLVMSSAHAINAAIGRALPYDTERDFAPIAQTTNQLLLIVAHPGVPVRTIKELITYSKSNPGKLNYGSSSNAVTLPMELFKSMTGADIAHIPYKGTAPMLNDLLGGHLQLSLAGLAGSLQHIKAGRLRALGTGDLKRSPQLPDVPTIAEQGVPGFRGVIWTAAIFAPRGTPKPIIARLHQDILLALQHPRFNERMIAAGFDVVTENNRPEDLAKLVSDDIARWTKVAKLAGIKPDN
jgi:tripartite-type tricarboxylate transporter receptor subunit TctC